MSTAVVLTSTTADGSMFNRLDYHDPSVIANRERFLTTHHVSAARTTMMYTNLNDRILSGETDYCRYKEVSLHDERGGGVGGADGVVADALITRELGHALFLPIADCVATTIFDPVHQILMLSHLGRHSLEQQGGTQSIRFLVEVYGSHAEDLLVWSSPAPNKEVYPIWKLNNQGMKEAWFEQMAAGGVRPEHITDNPADSAADPTYYSYSEFLKGHRNEDGDYCMVAVMSE